MKRDFYEAAIDIMGSEFNDTHQKYRSLCSLMCASEFHYGFELARIYPNLSVDEALQIHIKNHSDKFIADYEKLVKIIKDKTK